MHTYVYTAEARGGRDGVVRSGSGVLDLPTKPAGSNKEGITPEELVAAAWASCFGTTLIFAAREYGLDFSDAVVRTRITYEVDHEAGRYELARAELEAVLPPGDHPAADEALRVAHGRCPISRVLREGIPQVEVAIAGSANGSAAG
jgi:osmotically inducible protein OsmC